MIENTNQANTTPIEPPKKVLKMVKNERMGGYVPSWETPKTAQEQINTNLAYAGDAEQSQSFETALALQSDGSHQSAHQEEFGFGDLFDIVNPLHHIPLVGTAYRELTGDQIKPIGKIIGGGIFGGGIGAASGLVNAVVEGETGKDLAENAAAMVLKGEKPQFKSMNNSAQSDIGKTIQTAEDQPELPASLLAFTDQNTGYKSLNLDRLQKSADMSHALPPREPITTLEIKQKVPFKEL